MKDIVVYIKEGLKVAGIGRNTYPAKINVAAEVGDQHTQPAMHLYTGFWQNS